MSAVPQTPQEEHAMTDKYHSTKIASGLRHLMFVAHRISREHGFWEEYEETLEHLKKIDPGLAAKYVVDTQLSKMALVGSEIGEAVEGIRKPFESQKIPGFTNEEEEIADAIIRLAEYCEKFSLRLDGAILAKMAYNETRPYKHGKAA